MSSPFDQRYSSYEMRAIFSDAFKYTTWRKLWVALAEAEKSLGLPITNAQVQEMKDNVYNVDFDKAIEYERETHHDVMAHILAFGDQCPMAKPIIHLGATSCFVTDNTDFVQQYCALILVRHKLLSVIDALSGVASEYKSLRTVGYTHYQVAQPTTVGKRVCMWIQDLLIDLDELDHQLGSIKMLGCKGATGTAASFLGLFDGDAEKVKELEKRIARSIGLNGIYDISGQTYTRKQDFSVLQVLSGIAQSASKFANDMRLLSNLGEVTERYTDKQVGSSAMPYKVNPLNCERINSLSRLVICNLQNSAMTTATQWLERTLDDSANRRVIIPETFMAIDEVLLTYERIAKSMVVHTDVIQEHYNASLPLFITEPLLMLLVKKGGDRQKLHDRIRKITQSRNPYEIRTALVEHFDVSAREICDLEGRLTGLAVMQTERFLEKVRERVDEQSGQTT